MSGLGGARQISLPEFFADLAAESAKNLLNSPNSHVYELLCLPVISTSWDAEEAGSYEQPLSLAYSENFVLAAGDYVVEMYIDSHLAQRGGFTVLAEE